MTRLARIASFELRLTLAATLALLASTSLFAAEKENAAPEVQVQVIRAMQAYFTQEIRVTGFLVPREEAVVSLEIPGYRASEVLAAEGDRVSSGQALVRLARLPAEGLDPNADRRPMTMNLKAPAAGVITRSTAMVGATASPMQNEPLFRIASDEMELEAAVPSIHVPALAPKQTVRVEIEDNRELSGRVRLVPAAIDEKTQLGRVRISLMERDPRLRLGMFARGIIEANRSKGISVPHAAVVYRSDGPRVQVVRGNVVETRLVRVGYLSDTNTEILEGLHENDLVVANAGGSLRDGDKVKPIEPDSTAVGLR
jgi:multidrug efflux pump subunit AcrA (membrane-fusion protein)